MNLEPGAMMNEILYLQYACHSWSKLGELSEANAEGCFP
jgi:hypothetical protein